MREFIREVKPGELPDVLALYAYLHAADGPLPEKSFVQQAWQEILDDPRVHCLVVELDGVLVASCVLVLVPNLTRGARPYGLIENVVTHGDYRRRGLGMRLLRYALDLAWSQRCYKVMLLTGRKDEGVLGFYEKAGFRRGIKTGFIAYPPDHA